MKIILLISKLLFHFERRVLIFTVGIVMALMVLNVASRAVNLSLYWVDEAAVNLMVVFAFVGCSMMVRLRKNFAVTLLPEMLTVKGKRKLSILVQVVNLCFAVLLLGAAWLWFDPWSLAQQNFDTDEFFKVTFNSIYKELTTTIGIKRIWFFAIMPWYAVTFTIHSLACLVEDLHSGDRTTEYDLAEGA